MTKENEKRVPKLRFKGFTDDWEQRMLEDVVKINPGSKLPDHFHYVDLESVKGTELISSRIEYNDTAPSRAKRLARPGDIFFQLVRPYQKNNYLFNLTEKNYVFSTGYAQLRPLINSEYLINYLTTDNFTSKVLNRSTGTSYPAINSSDLVKIKVLIPNDELESLKIGEVLELMNKVITLHQRKLEQLEKLKQALLQQMFPQKDENVPRLRFANFNENWEQCKLRKILKERNEQIIESLEYPLMSFVQGIGVTPKDKRYDRSFLVKNKKKKYKKTELGDFIYSSNNLETGSIGFNKTGKAVISPVYSIFSSKSNIESKFIGIMSLRKDFINEMIRYRQGVVYGQWRIHEKDFLNIKISIPTQSEQLKISYLYKNLENIINLQQKKLSELKLIKQLLLKTLFI